MQPAPEREIHARAQAAQGKTLIKRLRVLHRKLDEILRKYGSQAKKLGFARDFIRHLVPRLWPLHATMKAALNERVAYRHFRRQ